MPFRINKPIITTPLIQTNNNITDKLNVISSSTMENDAVLASSTPIPTKNTTQETEEKTEKDIFDIVDPNDLNDDIMNQHNIIQISNLPTYVSPLDKRYQ